MIRENSTVWERCIISNRLFEAINNFFYRLIRSVEDVSMPLDSCATPCRIHVQQSKGKINNESKQY